MQVGYRRISSHVEVILYVEVTSLFIILYLVPEFDDAASFHDRKSATSLLFNAAAHR